MPLIIFGTSSGLDKRFFFATKLSLKLLFVCWPSAGATWACQSLLEHSRHLDIDVVLGQKRVSGQNLVKSKLGL